jgi:hypothetical protein
MQGNWVALVLLVVAVVLITLARAGMTTRDEDGEAADAPEDETGASPGDSSEGDSPSPGAETPWAVCQEQLMEAPPLEECDEVELPWPDEAELDPGMTPEAEVDPVAESGHAVNTRIRREAGRLFRENYRRILPLAAIAAALMAVRMFLPLIGMSATWLGGFGIDAITTAIAPVVALGAAFAAWRVWKGEVPRPAMLFYFLTGRRNFPALGLMILQALIMLLPLAALMVGAVLFRWIFIVVSSVVGEPVLNLTRGFGALLILVLITYVWLMACLAMVNFAMARAPEMGVFAAIRAGFRAICHKKTTALGMLLATGWPFGAALLAQYVLSRWSAFWARTGSTGRRRLSTCF